MRKCYLIYLLVLVLCNCKRSETPKELAPLEREKLAIEFAEYELSESTEKIFLLSHIEKIQYDTLYLILRDYYSRIDHLDSLQTYSDALTYIANKYKMPPPKVASLIFSFKYEMLQRDELLEDALEDQAVEDPAPRY